MFIIIFEFFYYIYGRMIRYFDVQGIYEYFLFMGGNCPGGNCPVGIVRWELSQMGIVRVGIVLDGNCPGGNCPVGIVLKMGIVRVGIVRWEFAGWELSGGNLPGGNCPTIEITYVHSLIIYFNSPLLILQKCFLGIVLHLKIIQRKFPEAAC